MFRELINYPIDPIPAQYADTLQRLDYEPDYSLTCLGIALLRPRIEGYNGIAGGCRTYDKENTCILDFIENRYPKIDTHPMFCYYRYTHRSDEENDTRERLEKNGFEIKESIGALIENKANIKCIAAYHKEKNCAVVIINSQDIKFYHMIISFMSLLFPNLFKEIPMKPEDFDLVRSLTKSDKDMFIAKIQESVKDYVVEFRRLMLSNLLQTMHDAKINRALDEVTAQRNNVASMERQIAQSMELLRNLIATYEGMKATEYVDQSEQDLIEYLADNKAIHNLEISGNDLTFSVATLLNNYNSSAWETFLRRGSILDGQYRQTRLLDVFNDRENRKILLNSIFCESPEFAVKICGNYTINLYNCYVSTSRHYEYITADPIYKSYVPNPHLKLFNCLGGYESRVRNALKDRNYIGAIEMCCASAGSVNLDETEQTFRPFLGWILTSREKILHRKDGVDMTPEEALVYLIDKEK